MSLYRRNGIWYYDFIVSGRRHNKSTGLTEKRKAAVVERDAMTRAKVIPKASMTFADAITRGYQDRWQHRKSGDQSIDYLNKVAAWLGPKTQLADLDREKLASMRAWLESSEKATATVNRYMAAVKTLLNMAYREWGVLAAVPYVPIRPEHGEERRALSPDEVEDIVAALRAAEHFDVAYLVQFLVDTGMRLGEALGLTFDDIRRNCAYLSDTKTGKPRVVPLTERAQDVVRVCQAAGHKLIFPFGKWKAARAFKGAVEAAGVDPKGVVLHSLRHTCCTRLVERGHLAGAQAILGHSTATMTRRYSHLSVNHLKEAIKVLE